MNFEQTLNVRPGQAAPPAFTCFGASNVGKVRSNNEDAFALEPAIGLCVVADGMGGLSRGEVASQAVVDAVREAVQNGLPLAEGLRLAHRRIRALTKDASADEHMGATAVALHLRPTGGVVAWVGDSRVYQFRAGKLEQLTRDHSFVQELMDRGVINEKEAAEHPNRSVVTRAIGVRDLVEVDVDQMHVELQPGDRLLLCSDGLSSYLPPYSIAEALADGGEDRQVVERLIARTLEETPAADNLTVVLATLKG